MPAIRKRQFPSLRPAHRVPIIPKSPRIFSVRRFFRRLGAYGQIRGVGKRIDEEFARLKSMKNFEDFGKRLDEELARVKSFVKEEVAPETEKRTAQLLREVSEKLTEAAARAADGSAPAGPPPPPPPPRARG